MARKDLSTDYEKRSYSVVFLFAVAFLLAGAIWSLYDDNIKRRPWIAHQATFSSRQQDKLRAEIAAEKARLEQDPTYQQLQKDLTAARANFENGEQSRRVQQLEEELAKVTGAHNDFDIELRIQKSRLEQAWYEYEHALHQKHPTEEHKHEIAELEERKNQLQQGFDDTKARIAQIKAEIGEIQSEITNLEAKHEEMIGNVTRLEQRLTENTLTVAGMELPPVPGIRQVVLLEFDRNNYDQPVARVDRCTSCHAGIDKPGFEDEPNPYKTHPNRAVLLGEHPTDQFGCTPCHGGQGAAVNSVEQAHGEVKFWNDPLLKGDKLQSTCIGCHSNVKFLEGADAIAHGETLFEELGCHNCHLVQGYETLAKVGPNLTRIAAKVEPAWLTRWVSNPHQYRPNTRMPNFLFTPEQGEAIAAFLLATTKESGEQWLAERPLPAGVDANNSALVAQGKELVDSIGCRGCHGFEEGQSPARLGQNKDIAPNLSNIAEKTHGQWIYHWIKNPRMFSPDARMPSLRLSDEEATAITSFLLTLGAPKPDEQVAARLANAELVGQGEKLVRKFGCAGCHNVTGMEKETRIGVELTTFASKPLTELFFGDRTDIPHNWEDWTFHKIRSPRIYATERIEQVMPNFALEKEDIVALRHFLRSRRADKPAKPYRADIGIQAQREIEGGRVVARYNCAGCHVIEGKGGAIRALYTENPTFAPPILDGEGAKVQPDWFFKFVKAPYTLRPWLKLRMPTFHLSDQETRQVVDYFGALAGLENPYVHVDEQSIPTEHLQAAQTLVSPDYFSCFSCHQQGDKAPEGPMDGWAPDLAMAHERLNPDWIIDWIHNPQKIQPGTKMPSFYEETEEGQAAGGPDDVLGGDNEKQIEAIRDYLMVLHRVDQILAQRGVKADGTNAEEPAPAAGGTGEAAM
ncbi:MAG TPA: c-type cytochrome [Terriglobales bacterium]|nr:c-type cytochrome [Terriglobales bacterium]